MRSRRKRFREVTGGTDGRLVPIDDLNGAKVKAFDELYFT